MYAVKLGGFVAFAVPDHALGYDRECEEVAFELLREDVFTVRCDDDVFLTTRDEDVVVSVEETDVSGVEPAFVVEDFGGVLRVVVVAHHYGRSAEAYLTDAVVVCAEYLALGERQEVACGSVFHIFSLDRVECDYWGALGQAVALYGAEAYVAEEIEYCAVYCGSARDHGVESAAKESGDVLGHGLRQFELEAACLAVHHHEGLEVFLSAFFLYGFEYFIVEILDDNRHRKEYGRFDLGDVLSYVFQTAAERDGRAAVYAVEECARALICVMHREYRETNVFWFGFHHGLAEHGIENEISRAEHDALGDACRAGCEEYGGEISVDDLSIDVATVAFLHHLASDFTEVPPGEKAVFGILVIVHIRIDDIFDGSISCGFYAFELFVILIVDCDYGFEFALDGKLVELVLRKLAVERYDDAYAACDGEVGLAPFDGVTTDKSYVPVLETEIHQCRAEGVDVISALAIAELSKRLIWFIFLHEYRQISVVVCAVIEHVFDVRDDMLISEEVALVLG